MNTADSFTSFFWLNRRIRIALLACCGLVILSGCSNSAVSRETGRDASEPVNSKIADVEKADDIDSNELVVAEASGNINEADSAKVSADAPVSVPAKAQASVAIAPSTEIAQIPPVDLEVGLTYAEARTRLLQQGWMPDEQPDPGPYGVERTMYDVGFTEVSACAGTGLGQCRFEFYHPDRMESGEDNVLSVITYGGSRPEVANWDLLSVADATSDSEDSETATVQSTIPVQFHGLWDARVAGCSNPGSDSRLSVGADRIEFYESSGPVTEVIVQGDLEATVYMELSGEGMTWTDISKLELSSDRNSLTITRDGFESVRYRCPDA